MRKRLAMLARKQIKHIPPESGCKSRHTLKSMDRGKLQSTCFHMKKASVSGLDLVHRLKVLDEDKERLLGSLDCAIEGAACWLVVRAGLSTAEKALQTREFDAHAD